MNYKNIEKLDPRTCISGKVSRISRITANIFRKHLQAHNITDSQLSILFILAKAGSKKQKDLCEIAKFEKSSLHRNLKRLLERALISRKDFPLIAITTKGKEVLETILPDWEQAMNEIKALLEEEGLQALNTVHNKLIR